MKPLSIFDQGLTNEQQEKSVSLTLFPPLSYACDQLVQSSSQVLNLCLRDNFYFTPDWEIEFFKSCQKFFQISTLILPGRVLWVVLTRGFDYSDQSLIGSEVRWAYLRIYVIRLYHESFV